MWKTGLHILKLVDAALCVALADLAQGLVLVAALSDVLLVEHVVARQLSLVLHQGKLLAQDLQ